jgi:hypothetical protein
VALVDWLSFAGTEIVNSARARAYMDAWGLELTCDPCATLDDALWGDQPDWGGYQGPDLDPAPWYDPAVPESARFLGVVGLAFNGFGNNPVDRTLTPRTGDGSFIGRLRRTQRELNLTLMLAAADDAAMVWGMEWLAVALRGTVCGPDACGGDELCALAACPCGPEGQYDRIGQRELRHLYDVALVSGPAENVRYTVPGTCPEGESPCGDPVIAEVSVTLVAGRPSLYHQPVPVDPEQNVWSYLTQGESVTGFDPDSRDDCPVIDDCLQDPQCPPVGAPLPAFPVPQDPCYPSGPYTAWRVRFPFSPLSASEWRETVPVLVVEAGERPLRRLAVRFIPNPHGIPCEELDPCQACAHFGVAYIPAGSTLMVDGRVERAAVDCPSANGSAFSVPNLYGPGGSAYTWPAFECGSALCVEVFAAADADDQARVRMELIPRSDLA